jgi:hypothetical protein
MVRRRRREDRVGLADAAIDALELGEESRNRTRAHRDVATNAHVAMAELPRHDAQSLTGVRRFDPQQVIRQQLAKPAMDLAKAFSGYGTSTQAARIDPALDADVRLGFELQIPLPRIVAVVVVERAFDVDGMRIVPLDEIAVVAK